MGGLEGRFWFVLILWGNAHNIGFHWGLRTKESTFSAGNEGAEGWIPGSGRSPGGGNGNPLQYACLENPWGQRSPAGYSPGGHEELDTAEATEHAGTYNIKFTALSNLKCVLQRYLVQSQCCDTITTI